MASIRPIVFGGRLVGWRDPDGTAHRVGTHADCPRIFKDSRGEIVLRGGDPEKTARLYTGLTGKIAEVQPDNSQPASAIHKCPDCGKELKTKLALRGHSRTHEKRR